MTKAALRETLKKQRLGLTADFQAACERSILLRIADMAVFKEAQHIAFYTAFKGEISCSSLLQYTLEKNKTCYLPIINDNQTLNFGQYQQGSTLVKNKFGIDEPAASVFKDPNALDLIFLPLVGFDKAGHRLGMGAGFYDRTFGFLKKHAFKKPVLIGLGFEFQYVNEIPVDAWDVDLSQVVTEKRIYLF